MLSSQMLDAITSNAIRLAAASPVQDLAEPIVEQAKEAQVRCRADSRVHSWLPRLNSGISAWS